MMRSFTVAMLAIVKGSSAFLSMKPLHTTSSHQDTSASSRPGHTNAITRNLVPLGGMDHDALHSTSLSLSLFWKHMDPDDARGQFFFFFAAGTGAGGIGLGAVPKILKEIGDIQELGAEGPTEGGEPLDVSPIATLFYPTTLSKADVQKVIDKIPSPATISAQGTSTSYFASKGYIDRQDFIDSLLKLKCNPLASYAAFDAISKGSGSCVSPVVLEDKVSLYRADGGLSVFASDLQAATTTKVTAYAGLAFLLLLIADLIVESGINAFLE